MWACAMLPPTVAGGPSRLFTAEVLIPMRPQRPPLVWATQKGLTRR